MRNILSAVVAISAAAAVLAPMLARGGVFRDLESTAGQGAVVAVPAAPVVVSAAAGQPQAASEQELIRFKDRISAPVLALSDVVGVGISADANGKPMLLIFFLTNKTSAAKVRQAALNVLPTGAAKQLQAYEAAGQLKFAPTARVEG